MQESIIHVGKLFLSLVLVLIGTGIIVLVHKREKKKGPNANRRVLGLSFLVGALFWWASTVILLVYDHSFYFMLNLATVLLVFVGGAFFFPAPPNAASEAQHSMLASIFIFVGFALGLCHSLALTFTEAWPTHLLKFYALLGLR